MKYTENDYWNYKETYFNTLYKLGKHTEDGNIVDIGFIDYMKELGFIPKDDLILEVAVVWYYDDANEIQVDHIYDNTDFNKTGQVFVTFDESETKEKWTDNHEALINSILMYGDLGEDFGFF